MRSNRLFTGFPPHTRLFNLPRHPINDLPSELLILIFQFYTLNEPSAQLGAGITSSSKAISLGRVCRLWRSVTLRVPELWSNIVIASTNGFRKYRKALSLHLEHLKGSLVSLRLGMVILGSNQLSREIETLLLLLSNYSSQFRAIHVPIMFGEMWDMLKIHTAPSNCAIESLSFCLPLEELQLSQLARTLHRSNLSHLRHFTLPGFVQMPGDYVI